MVTASDSPHHYIELQTGPWEGKGSWLWRIRCMENGCDYVDYATNYDDASDARAEHKEVVGVEPVQPRRKVRQQPQEEEWEEF